MISLIPIQQVVLVVLILQAHEGFPDKSGDLELFNIQLIFINTFTHRVFGYFFTNFDIVAIDDLDLMGEEGNVLISYISGWISVFISLFEIIVEKIMGF